jgi:hypothetical protein
VEAVIAERIGRIPYPQQEMLRVASVEGETFTAEVVAMVLGLDERLALSWLSGLLSREQKIVQAVDVARTRPVSSRSTHPSLALSFWPYPVPEIPVPFTRSGGALDPA